ncbi:MAG: SNF2-related protein [Treponema sp.]|nr:SNF2-related protein [Treponema sp.]
MTNDLKFFTNDGDGFTLYDRFKRVLSHTKYFDILVGYFRSSGFHRLYKEFDAIDKIRILVGLNVDKPIFQIIDTAQKIQGEFDFEQSDRIKDNISNTLVREVEGAEDTKNVEDGILKFVEYLKCGKIEIKAHPSQNIHAKVYIMRHGEGALDFGRVITGSSNFSESGLVAQHEFNVELKDSPDVKFALQQFEKLWNESIDVTKDYIDTISTKTQLNPEITPYYVYLKFLYEYFKEEINDDRDIDIKYPQNFMKLKYQEEAVLNARRILKDYNGVFLADVVGLGKTYITSMLLQILNDGQKLIICPPTLIDYWEETLREFYVPGAKVVSLGKLDKVIKKDMDNYDYIVIDEAHRFRNEMTAGFDNLYQICKNKKVVLVSATPLNNKLGDIEALLKLFMNMKSSPIPGMKNLEKVFADARTQIDKAKKDNDDSQKHLEIVKYWSAKIRENVLRHVMVRRTRTEIKNYYQKDMQNQGLSFPELTSPETIVYEFDDKVEFAFDKTIELLKDNNFRYSRYTPLLYLKNDLNQFEIQQQKNMRDFMKGILIKRLESSFCAFKKTVERFAESYRSFIKMYKAGEVYIGKKNIFELLEDEDFARIEKYIAEDKLQRYESKDFNDSFIECLDADLKILEKIQSLWENITDDPKLNAFRHALKTKPILKKQKLIIFTEAKETADYLYENLSKEYPKDVFAISGAGGMFRGETHNFQTSKDLVEESYKPFADKSKQKDNIRILITTDVLAEGVNLHRSNVLINYDLPWNPTRVLQRVGRVNRVGTEHSKVHLFNFFPTEKSNDNLRLEENIIAKINAFHSALGEDSKYLSPDEEIVQHGLAERLYKRLTSAPVEESEDENSTLGYLKLLRDIRDKDPDLFKRVKNLPKKIRATQKIPNGHATGLLTFFRKGTLKKFIYSTDRVNSEELTLNEAVQKFECPENEKNIKLPEIYYDLLAANKKHLQEITQDDDIDAAKGNSNIKQIVSMLDGIKKHNDYTDADRNLIIIAGKNIANGSLSKYKAKNMWEKLKNAKNQQQALGVVKDFQNDWQGIENIRISEGKNEVILSKCFQRDE